MSRIGNIQYRLALYVGVGLLAFSIIVGGIIYSLSYNEKLGDVAATERQIVNTVRAQAEVAVFAANAKIAEGVIEGLRADPHIRAVRIAGESAALFNISAGLSSGPDTAESIDYPLFSPVNGAERIGTLTVIRNETVIQTEARLTALRQTLIMIAQILATTALIMLFTRHLIGRPVELLADTLTRIQPGDGTRIRIDARHENDEIGSLARSANALLDTAEKALAEVRELATIDALTGLLNRRAFMTSLELELARIKRYELPPACILMLDLDYFKQINDCHGHAAGDIVLHAFGQTLAAELRKVDTAGRIGGEEFAIVLPATESTAAMVFAERLRQTVAAAETRLDGMILHITVSIGVAQLLGDDARPEDALARADRALYHAKETGRNRVVSDSTIEGRNWLHARD